MAFALHRTVLPPSGVQHAVSCTLQRLDTVPLLCGGWEVTGHLVTASEGEVRVFQVEEHAQTNEARLVHLASSTLHGHVLSLARVRTLDSKQDGCDRLVISFSNAKMALMEWHPSSLSLLPLSLHTFEKLPQLVDGQRARMAVDQGSRVAVLLLEANTGGEAVLAVLPVVQEELEWDEEQMEGVEGVTSLPYAPSHLLALSSISSTSSSLATRSSTLANTSATTASTIRNVQDLTFLPGFNEPTLALLYSPEPTWVGRTDFVKSNYCVAFVTLVTSSSSSSPKDGEGQTTAVVIATATGLPHTAVSLHPCPPDVGGVLLLTQDGVIHLEQGGKTTSAAANGWFGRTAGSGNAASGAPAEQGDDVAQALEAARVTFVSNSRALIFCRSGKVLELVLQIVGRSVVSMRVRPALLQGQEEELVPASCVERIKGPGKWGGKGLVFVGSETGESLLLHWELEGAATAAAAKETNGRPNGHQVEKKEVNGAPAASAAAGDMDVDFDEDDLYGDSNGDEARAVETAVAAAAATIVQPHQRVRLSVADKLEGYGSIRSIITGKIEDAKAELVAATGRGKAGGLTAFHRSIVPHKRRRIGDSVVGARGIWSLSETGQIVGSSEGSSVIFSINREESQGTQGTPLEDQTVKVFGVKEGSSHWVRVATGSVELYDQERLLSSAPFPSGKSKATSASFTDSFCLVNHADGSSGLYRVDGEAVAEIPCQALEDAKSAVLYHDSSRSVPLLQLDLVAAARQSTAAAAASGEMDDDLYESLSKPAAAAGSGSRNKELDGAVVPPPDGEEWNWLVTITSSGQLSIFLLPTLELVFTAGAVTAMPDAIENGLSVDIPPQADLDDLEVMDVLVASVGQRKCRPHLIIRLKSGLALAYEAVPSLLPKSSISSAARELGVSFVKTAVHQLPLSGRRPKGSTLPPALRTLVPFVQPHGYSGVFLTGEKAFWILASDHGPAHFYPHEEGAVYGFASLQNPLDGHFEFLFQTANQLSAGLLSPDLVIDRSISYTRAPLNRHYSSIVHDPDSGQYLAAAVYDTPFMAFSDDTNEPLFTDNDSTLLKPTSFRSALELVSSAGWVTFDGFEFRPNEFVTAMRTVSLITKSTKTGRKEFVAIGTTISRGEDLSARGALYLFEVVKVNAFLEGPDFDYRLRLRCFEDAKAPIANICDSDGYVIFSMGQKLYARALEQDQYLIAVGFLDIGVHVTSLETLKNFIVIGDSHNSVWFVVFQEDPYRLVILGKDYRPTHVSHASFLVNENKISLVTADTSGVLRLLDYDPTNIASQGGQKLLCRTEYSTGSESQCAMTFARQPTGSDEVRQNGQLYGGTNGSIYTLVPVRDAVFRRLQALQTSMGRHVQHFAGLNPRGHRVVRNDTVSRAMLRGILDGDLLGDFERLPLDLQLDLAAAVGTDTDTVLLNLRNLSGPW